MSITSTEKTAIAAWATATALALAAFIPALLAYRVLFADGSYLLYMLLETPHRFVLIEFGRAFALHIMEAPVLMGQMLSVESIGAMAMLLHLGVFGVPLAVFLAALWFARRDAILFALSVAAFALFSFSINFINTETNLYFALSWLAGVILALPGSHPLLRGALFPIVAALAISNHESAIFTAPLLAVWATHRAYRATSAYEATGLGLAAFLFWAGAAVAVISGIAPRDIGNAYGFVAHFSTALTSPQRWLFLCAVLAPCALFLRHRGARIACAVLAISAGFLYVDALLSVSDYFGFRFYHTNRAGLALFLPVALAVLWFTTRSPSNARATMRPAAMYAVALIPLVFAVSGDWVGTYRWNGYIDTFCTVLRKDLEPTQRLDALVGSGQTTGWSWTHPTLSVLLRAQDSSAFVPNQPGAWDPPNVQATTRLNRPGICPVPSP